MGRRLLYLLLVGLSLLTGCSSLPTPQAAPNTSAPPAAATETAPPPKPTEKIGTDLSDELLFHFLAGEIGAQRSAFDEALPHYLAFAREAKDPWAAERAARISFHLKDYGSAVMATEIWIQLAPDSLNAHQMAVIGHLRTGQYEAAVSEMEAVLRLSEGEDYQGYLRLGSLLAGEHGSKQSQFLMHKFLLAHHDVAGAHYGLTLVLLSANDNQSAIQSLRRTLELDPRWDKPYILLSRILVSQREPAAALGVLEEGLQAKPHSIALNLALAQLLVERKDYLAARERYQQAHQLQPEDADTLFAVGLLSLELGDRDQARRYWLELRDRPGNYDRASLYLGQLEEQQGNLDLASGLYGAVRSGEHYLDARLALARLQTRRGEFVAAAEVFSELRALNPNDAGRIYATEAELLEKAGRSDQAATLFADAVEAQPDDMDLRYSRGLWAAGHGDLETAETDFRVILERNPDNAEAANALGYTLADQTNRLDEALSLIQHAHRLDPSSNAILDSLGWVYFRLGDLENALKYLRMAAAGIEDDEISAHLVEVLWTLGQQDEARQVWERALSSSPDSELLKRLWERLN